MLTILIVEDEPTNAEVLRVMLEAEGHHVVVTADAIAGLAVVKERDLDLVFMDLQLPGPCDGVEAVRQLRANLAFKGLIVCQSARCSEADQQECLLAGADAFLTKPFRRKDALGVIGQLTAPGRLGPQGRRSP